MYKQHEETAPDGITYGLWICESGIGVEGNAIASGDDEYDAKVEKRILSRLNRGDLWAWCDVECRATFNGFSESDYLGGCSYKDAADFLTPGGYWQDMKDEAREQLLRVLESACATLDKLRTTAHA